jgi:hypothetical protein
MAKRYKDLAALHALMGDSWGAPQEYFGVSVE